MEKNSIRKILHRLDLERRQLMRPKFLELGLTVGEGQPRILDCLLDRKELTQRELADLCMFDVTTMSRTLDKMEQAGLIQRNKNPVSRRSHLISLTEKGKEKGKQVREEFNWLDEMLQKGLAREELETLYSILEKIEKNLTDI
mgnify:FL=1